MSITKNEIRAIFRFLELGDADSFFANVSLGVDWTVMGTHPAPSQLAVLEHAFVTTGPENVDFRAAADQVGVRNGS